MKKSLIPLILLLFAGLMAQSQTNQRTISVDVAQEHGKMNTMFKECIGAGRANEGLRADWQQQLITVKKECDFKYIRFHGLLTDDMGIYKEDHEGNPQYNFMYVDALFDFLLSIDITPFVELGFMPKALASGDETIFWWEGNVTPPNDYDKWGNLIKNLVQHFTDRYGEEEVKKWYFEVWNEPNLTPAFWTGTQKEYFKLYKYAAEAVKSVCADYPVGGPATAGAAWESEMIEFCKKKNVPLNFISTHSYGVDVGFLDEFGNNGTRLSKNDMAVSQDVIQSRKEISESSMPDLELHYTEWSSSYTPSDPLHDSYHEAAFILNKIKQIGDAATSMSYWVFTDIFEEAGPRFTPFHGGFGLMNTQGIKKPAYHAYALMNQLGETELKNSDKASWACKNNEGSFQLLLWDYTHTLPDSINNQDYYNNDLPAKDKGVVDVKVNGLTPGTYSLKIHKVGYRCTDAYTAYSDLGSPDQLSKKQVDLLKEMTNESLVSTEIIKIGTEGTYTSELKMRENDVYFIDLEKL